MTTTTTSTTNEEKYSLFLYLFHAQFMLSSKATTQILITVTFHITGVIAIEE